MRRLIQITNWPKKGRLANLKANYGKLLISSAGAAFQLIERPFEGAA